MAAPLVGLFLVLFSCVALSEQQQSTALNQWAPPKALLDQHDWVQLNTNEWIAGRIHALFGNRLLFQSRKFKLREYLWRDIKRLYSAKVYQIATRDKQKLLGRIQIVADTVVVTDLQGDPLTEFPRAQLLAVAPGERLGQGVWAGKWILETRWRSGNSEQVLLGSDFSLRHRTLRSRWETSYLANYTKTRGTTSVNNHRVNTLLAFLVSDTLFVSPLSYEFFRDPFTNISQRHTYQAGVGWILFDSPEQSWDIKLGLGYQHTKYRSVEEGDSRRVDTPVLGVQTQYDRELTSDIDIKTTYRGSLVNDKSGTYLQHWKTALSVSLTTLLDLELAFIWDRIEDPKENSDGTKPDRDDFELLLGVGITF